MSVETISREEFDKRIEGLKGNFLDRAGPAFQETATHGIISQREKEDEFVKTNYKHESWQHHVFHFMEGHTIEKILLFLLLVDITIVIIEIYMEAIFPTCDIIANNDLICCPEENHDHRFLETDHHAAACDASIEYICDDHNHALHTAHTVMFAVSVAILCLFELENLLKLAILKGLFLANAFYVLDIVVVSISLAVDVIGHSFSRLASELTSLLVIARVWRFVRVIHGVYAENVKLHKGEKQGTVEAMDDFIKGVEKLVHEVKVESKE